MAHIHEVTDTGMHFKINAETRAITKDAKGSTMLAQGDHNSERFTFDLPRYVDGHDMSTCNVVEVHYINTDQKTKRQNVGVYQVDDLNVDADDESTVHCSWLVSQNATQYAGTLSFVIRFICTTEGNIDYVWNTTVYSGVFVGECICNSGAVVEEYADVLNVWRELLFGEAGLPVGIAALDFSNWKNGSFTETLEDGTVNTYNVGFNEDDEPVSITDADGKTLRVTW